MFTARIIKGGALLADSLRFIEAWNPDLRPEENLVRFAADRVLAKTQIRQKVVLDILRRRFLDPGTGVVGALRRLMQDPTGFREACYYEATRTDELLAAFAEGPLFAWYEAGRREVSLDDVGRWLASDARVPRWNMQTRLRVARGLLATVRDFGILRGAARGRRKQIAPPRLSIRGFIYVALRERNQSNSDRALINSSVWRRYLLSTDDVRHLFREADRLGYLRFAEVGSMVRVDWLVKDLEEIPDVVPA
jgi:hypothetical protein